MAVGAASARFFVAMARTYGKVGVTTAPVASRSFRGPASGVFRGRAATASSGLAPRPGARAAPTGGASAGLASFIATSRARFTGPVGAVEPFRKA